MIRQSVEALAVGALVALMIATGGTAGAQTKPAAQQSPADQADQLLNTPVNDGEAYHRAEDSEQDPAEVRTTQALNAEIASRNDLAENQERADQAAFEAERARYEAAVTQANQERLAHEEAVRAADAARRAWEADRARWEADVRACEAGDRSRCAAPR